MEKLVGQGDFKDNKELEDLLLLQTLDALVCLAIEGIIHRDLKPENILYERDPSSGKITFRVADLGCGNYASAARTYVGTPIFMAPELLSNGSNIQTTKMDVWSLGATMVDVLNIAGFQDKRNGPQTHEEAVRFIRRLRNDGQLGRYEPMLIEDVESRASAADMRVTLIGAEGCTAPPAKAPRANPPPAKPPPTNALRTNLYAAAGLGGRPIMIQKLPLRPGVGLAAPPIHPPIRPPIRRPIHRNAKGRNAIDRHYKDTTRKFPYGDGVSRTHLRPRKR